MDYLRRIRAPTARGLVVESVKLGPRFEGYKICVYVCTYMSERQPGMNVIHVAFVAAGEIQLKSGTALAT